MGSVGMKVETEKKEIDATKIAKELMGFGIMHRSRVTEPGRNLGSVYSQLVDYVR